MGDVVAGRGVARQVGGTDPWRDLHAHPGDRWVGNLEGAVAEGTCSKGPLCLDADLRLLDYAAALPFVAMSVENNHAHDYGETGRRATLAALAERGIAAIGTAPTLLEAAGRRWALVAVDLTEHTQARAEAARLAVARAAALAPWVVVMPHWGVEFGTTPTPEQEALARSLHHWGAAVVAGSGPHVIQPSTCDDEGGTWPSLGNHLFDQRQPETWTGQAVRCCPAGDGGLDCHSLTTRRDLTSTLPRWDEEDGPSCHLAARSEPDLRWLSHADAAAFEAVYPLPDAGDGAFVGLARSTSTFDHEAALRPKVFQVQEGHVRDLWRGTAIGRPLVAARVRADGALCAVHRDDSFLHPHPDTTGRTWAAWRWNGFGFDRLPGNPASCD